jgi:16S rRNA (adenine1518-N6/adenine1519-N6)-dimethyltransferase
MRGAQAFRMTDLPPQLPPLREVVNRHGLFASKALGQNFLFDEQLLDRIARCPAACAGRTCWKSAPVPAG